MKDAHAQVESHSMVSAVETMRELLAERILVEHGGTHGPPVRPLLRVRPLQRSFFASRRAEPGFGGGTACPGVEA